MGMPRGAVRSPPLFNFYVHDLQPASGDVNESFADDFHNGVVLLDLSVITTGLNQAAEEMNVWAGENRMGILAQKSTVTLFTPWTRQVNVQLDVKIDDVVVPTVKNPRLLGVVFDPTFSFSAHATSVARKASSQLNIL